MFNLSLLRTFGLIAGVVAIGVAIRRLRTYRSTRNDVLFLSFIGALLCLVSLFPSVVNIPAELFSLGNRPGGRILTLVMGSSLFLWALLFWERNKVYHLKRAFDESLRRRAMDECLERMDSRRYADSILVLIPVLNEADNLAILLPTIPKAVGERAVFTVVIDDGSTDGSAEVARDCGAAVVRLPVNRGGGNALKTAFALAERVRAFAVVTMDGDGQHNAAEIATLVGPIERDEADIVIGSRILGEHEQVTHARTIGIRVFNFLINLAMSSRITDCSSGFRAVRASALRALDLRQDQYHTAEFLLEAIKHNARITERPVTIKRRLSGESKKGRDLIYGMMFFRTVLKAWLR